VENKYLVKVCALLKAPPNKNKIEKTKPYSLKPKINKYEAKINSKKLKQGKTK